MSSLNIKQGSDAIFPSILWRRPVIMKLIYLIYRSFMAGQKNGHGGHFCICLPGLLISFILPQKWTSAAVVTLQNLFSGRRLRKHSLSFVC